MNFEPNNRHRPNYVFFGIMRVDIEKTEVLLDLHVS